MRSSEISLTPQKSAWGETWPGYLALAFDKTLTFGAPTAALVAGYLANCGLRFEPRTPRSSLL